VILLRLHSSRWSDPRDVCYAQQLGVEDSIFPPGSAMSTSSLLHLVPPRVSSLARFEGKRGRSLHHSRGISCRGRRNLGIRQSGVHPDQGDSRKRNEARRAELEGSIVDGRDAKAGHHRIVPWPVHPMEWQWTDNVSHPGDSCLLFDGLLIVFIDTSSPQSWTPLGSMITGQRTSSTSPGADGALLTPHSSR
jgi:hypothetical protein